MSNSTLVPIAARSIEDINTYVGIVKDQIVSRNGRINAMSVLAYNFPVVKDRNIPIWNDEKANIYEKILHPEKQIWVHVDYSNYRKGYIKLCDEPIPEGYFLDHIQNREAIRYREYSHPFLRLCPVSRQVNTNSGSKTGGEGMEREYLRSLKKDETKWKEFLAKLDYGIVYADPMDLTKMLNISPGTQVLQGVGENLNLFYKKS